MRKVETILSNAIVLEKHAPSLQAEQGSKVAYVQHETGEKRTITLVDPLEADPLEGYVSVQSPVGSTLLGCQVSDSVTIATPKGDLHLTITALE
ncbi:Transcription elongation factor GreA [compost metagenome]